MFLKKFKFKPEKFKNTSQKLKQDFMSKSLYAMQSRGISTYAKGRFETEWEYPIKQQVAKKMVFASIVPTVDLSRQVIKTTPPFPKGKEKHSSVKYALASTYGKSCQVDKIDAVCPEHLLLMRSAIGIARKPSDEVLMVARTVGDQLGNELSQLGSQKCLDIIRCGSNISETRSKDFVKDFNLLIRTLRDDKTPPERLLRALEFVLSPVGMIANSYGGPFCLINRAKKQGVDVSDVEHFMKNIMTSLQQFHTPYIKQPGSPFAHLQMREYTQNGQLSDEEQVTVNQFLECCDQQQGIIPEIPQLRSVIVHDPTGRTVQLHDHLNLPHFFDVSGTTGALMQSTLGFLHRAGRSDLVSGSEATINLGMVLAGCNFYKQGYHNFYEVLPALHWVNHNVWNEPYVQMTPKELLHAVPDTISRCVDQSTEMASIVEDTMKLVTEHSEIHYDLYKQSVQQMMNQAPTITHK